MLIISPEARVSPLADIEDSTRGTRIEIGPHCRIDAFVKVKPAGGLGDVVIGHTCFINSGTVIYTGNGVRIGNHVLIAANTTLAPVNHQFRSRDKLIVEQGFMPSRGGIVIEDDVWIGANCVILDGAHIRRGCVIAAGSVVRGELPEYAVCAGNPAIPKSYRA
ncbi:MAG TPA: acetyltransferase [Rhodocyclaceae bacterium]|nr:MAG: acetyltransferase [Betaproteobacteria bacterium CG2_30_68_42]PIV71993.1 MAG: acetyltransferase [Rhodocyclales bacterium CG17_big_fil_post_rev_8_21_14_2_50_68_7]PIX74481.1 MAG: acetyltransferase [Rhodocyclales bacterium CG_4_10_14_3_um_filter_68_10]PJA56745.1 MAG: acetyltransferase [Rhodocyclales bacterium CG_4_9_14_3_um_filter_68_10]HCX34309.1 acetyltransferase [Rhodocyclaceae bacterium]